MFKFMKKFLVRNDRIEDSLRRKKEIPKPAPPEAMKVSPRKIQFGWGYTHNPKTGEFGLFEIRSREM